MPRKILESEINNMVELLLEKNEDGVTYKWGQRQLEQMKLLSRPFIRKLASQVGREFMVNGRDIKTPICCCVDCGTFFRRPPSKINRAENNFCSPECRISFSKGKNAAGWVDGRSIKTVGQWIKSTADYEKWRKLVLERDGGKCQISGRDYEIDVHHIELKSENPSKALDIDNGMTLNREVHRKIHSYMRSGMSFIDCCSKLKEEYSQELTNK